MSLFFLGVFLSIAMSVAFYFISSSRGTCQSLCRASLWYASNWFLGRDSKILLVIIGSLFRYKSFKKSRIRLNLTKTVFWFKKAGKFEEQQHESLNLVHPGILMKTKFSIWLQTLGPQSASMSQTLYTQASADKCPKYIMRYRTFISTKNLSIYLKDEL